MDWTPLSVSSLINTRLGLKTCFPRPRPRPWLGDQTPRQNSASSRPSPRPRTELSERC